MEACPRARTILTTSASSTGSLGAFSAPSPIGSAAGPQAVSAPHPWPRQDLSVPNNARFHHPTPGAAAPKERGLHPPDALLSWVIRHLPSGEAKVSDEDYGATKRRALARNDAAVDRVGARRAP